MYQTGRSERCIYNVPISGALDSRLQVKQVSFHGLTASAFSMLELRLYMITGVNTYI